MATEIERKFLVATLEWRHLAVRTIHVRQAYLSSGDSCSVRVRIVDDRQAFLTIKTPRSGFTRNEFQYDIPHDQACRLMKLRQSDVIEKIRHCIDFAGRLWEVDQFLGRNDGLVIAEVELPSEDTEFLRPNWVGREVTGERRYHNSELARYPFCEWQEPIAFISDHEGFPAGGMRLQAEQNGALLAE